ncbi:MAG: Cof-type HAD-IIB family hydrolase [Chloroflexota bacterium]
MSKQSVRAQTSPVKLLALDLDGTLIDVKDHCIHPVVESAVRQAIDLGVTVGIATGRPYQFSLPIAKQLGLSAPLIGYQGAEIKTMNGDLIRECTIPREAIAIVRDLATAEDWQVYVERNGALFIENGRVYDPNLIQIQNLEIIDVDDLASVRGAHQIGLFFGHTPGEGAAEILIDELGSKATVFQTHVKFVNIVANGVSKGDSLSYVAAKLGIDREQTMAVGDSENDISMISWAGIGVAMGDAREKTKASADWIAPAFQQHGVAKAIEKFILES